MKKTFKKNLIISSISSAGKFVIFVKKMMNCYVNYQKINVIMKRKSAFIATYQNFFELNWSIWKKYILNIQRAYNLIWIKPNDKSITFFKTRYDHFKYKINSFELINIFFVFQNYISKIINNCLNFFVIIFLKNIFIFSKLKKKSWKAYMYNFETFEKKNIYYIFNCRNTSRKNSKSII